MKAVVLCAGKGTRIREVTRDEKPKPMIEVKGKPLLEYIISWLDAYDVDEVLINLHHKGEDIQNYFGDSYGDLSIRYYWEDELLGTAGALTQMKGDIEDRFFVVYGDIVSDLDLGVLKDYQKNNSSLGTVVVYQGEEDLTQSSIISLDKEDRIDSFIEKPDRKTVSLFKGDIWTNSGIYCLEPEILDFIGEDKQDFSYDVFPDVLASSESLKGYRLPEETYWKEVGNPERYRELKTELSESDLNW